MTRNKNLKLAPEGSYFLEGELDLAVWQPKA